MLLAVSLPGLTCGPPPKPPPPLMDRFDPALCPKLPPEDTSRPLDPNLDGVKADVALAQRVVVAAAAVRLALTFHNIGLHGLQLNLPQRAFTLEGFQLGDRPNDLFVVFKDATSGDTTYGAGRFLWVKGTTDGKTVVDFNQAWNPLCAYSDGYNCPLAPPENRLSIPIPVGEAPYGHR